MKDFIGKTFNEELEFWEYLKSLKNNRFECANGYYWARAHGLDKKFAVYAIDHFATYEIFNQASYKFPHSKTSFTFGIRDNSLFEIFFTSHTISALLEKKSDCWEQTHFRDLFEDDSYMPYKITKEEMQACCKELAELLVINGKKVD